MCEVYDQGIEHPNQDWWGQGYSEQIDSAHQEALRERYIGSSEEAPDMSELLAALHTATLTNHSKRYIHEQLNLKPLGLNLSAADKDTSSPLQQEYDRLTGRADKIGDFILWFSRASHAAYVAQEGLPLNQRFEHISLELGGMRQWGDWDATRKLDNMVTSIPEQVLSVAPDAHMTMYGYNLGQQFHHPSVTYNDEAPKSYTLYPSLKIPHELVIDEDTDIEAASALNFDYSIIRRRRPVADIYITGQSDIVIFKESIGVLVMQMVENDIRESIIADCQRVIDEKREQLAEDSLRELEMKFQDTPAAKMVGKLFEITINNKRRFSRDILPVSAHIVQAVGAKFARFRTELKAA